MAERVDAQRRKVEDYAVWKDYHGRFDSYPAHSEELQSSEIRSLTLKSSAKGIHPEFECRAQNRVHIEMAAFISLRLVALLLIRRGNILGDIMLEENKCCGNCAYHDDWTWVCFNPEADDRADFTDNEHKCNRWTSREENSCEKKI